MQQPELKKRLREYIERSHLQRSSVTILERAVRWFGRLHPDIPLDRVNYGHIDDYRSWLKKGRSGASANCYMSMVKGFFGWLFKRGYIPSDPFEGIKRFVVAEKFFDQYEPDEIARILKVADTRWRAMVCLALCSMRKAEILNLVISDIDFEKNQIHITGKKRTAMTWYWHIKDHNEALVGIDDQIAKLLIELIERLGTQPYVILKEYYWKRNLRRQAEGTLTADLANNPWGNFTRDFAKLLKRANVPYKRFHDLRGTFATERYRDGFELLDLQYLMRHSSVQTTARYIKREDHRRLISRSARTFTKKYYATSAL